jgi:hypothetical protein
MPRPAQPWFYAAKNSWYVWLGDRKVSLGVRGEENKAGAMEAWHRLMANGRPTPEAKTEAPTVAEVVRVFLADTAGRVSKGTLRNYTAFLTPFVQQHGRVRADRLTPALAEFYARKPTWGGTHRGGFLTTLTTAFRWAERKGAARRQPAPSPPQALPNGSCGPAAHLGGGSCPAPGCRGAVLPGIPPAAQPDRGTTFGGHGDHGGELRRRSRRGPPGRA